MNKRTICLGLTQSARQEVMQHSAFPVCICKLTLAWISSETSTKLLGMPTYPDRSSSQLWTSSHPTCLSAVRCRLVTHVTLRQLPTSQSLCLTHWLAFPSYFRTRRDLEFKSFVWFRAKTKGSSAWRTTYLVLHCSLFIGANFSFFYFLCVVSSVYSSTSDSDTRLTCCLDQKHNVGRWRISHIIRGHNQPSGTVESPWSLRKADILPHLHVEMILLKEGFYKWKLQLFN